MNADALLGEHYVRLGEHAAEEVAPFVRLPPAEIAELLVDVEGWPDAIRPRPRAGRDGRLIAGDPLLVGADQAGLHFAGRDGAPILVPWQAVRSLQALRRLEAAG